MSYPPTEQGWSGDQDESVTLTKDDPAAGVAREQVGYGQETYGSPPQVEQQAAAPGGHGGPAAGWPPPTSTKAIIALCTVFYVPVLGIVFGVMARREIARTGEAGRAYATWGMALGIAFTVLWVLYLLFFVGIFVFGALGTAAFSSTGSGF